MPYSSCPIPDPLTYHSTVNDYGIPLGRRFTYQHATYGEWVLRFVQNTAASVTLAAGSCVAKVGTTGQTVTGDLSSGDGLVGLQAGGIALCAAAVSEFMLVLVDGYYPTVATNGDDDIGVGDILILSTTDKSCDSLATGANTVTATKATSALGTAMVVDVDADNTVAAMIGRPFVI